MSGSDFQTRHYWELLTQAQEALTAGNYPEAERLYESAVSVRGASPGRVFFTEKVGDSLARLFRKRQTENKPEISLGRWGRESRAFLERFKADGNRIVREGVRIAELRPEDDAEANQPILEISLFLVTQSRLFGEEPSSGVPLLKGLFRTARRTARPFPVNLVRHDLPLTEEDRLWLARRSSELMAGFMESGHLETGSAESEKWAQALLKLLQEKYFGSVDRFEEERCWLEASNADLLMGSSDAALVLYKKYLVVNPQPGERSDQARVRMLEMLANVNKSYFSVPRYEEALTVMGQAGLAPDSTFSSRFENALRVIEHRCPDPEPGESDSPVWASVAVENDGTVGIVFWWNGEPRDVAYWKPGDPLQDIATFIEPCLGRIIGADEGSVSVFPTDWKHRPGEFSLRDYLTLFMEKLLPNEGCDQETLLRLAMSETSQWRESWRHATGPADLQPPGSSSLLDTWRGGHASEALLTGLVWLAVRTRIEEADPSLRAGIGAMARRGDKASRAVYDFLVLGRAAHAAMDANFEPWTLPLLWTRPDPYGLTAVSGTTDGPTLSEGENRLDLGRNNLAIVGTGEPASVMAAWGGYQPKWRVVLDSMGRLAGLGKATGRVIGPVTIIPSSGMVHALKDALGALDKMLEGDLQQDGQDGHHGILPLLHWLHLVESHNGDLLDFLEVRPGRRDWPLFQRYTAFCNGLAQVQPSLADAEGLDPWANQFSQRVRKAGLVAGGVDQLGNDPLQMDSLWGVFEGSDVSWVFLDSAVIHWTLLRRGESGIQEMHSFLHSRGGRHLSLLTGSVWLKGELEELLGTWLSVFGSPYCLAMTDSRPPLLKLADKGPLPEGLLTGQDALAGQRRYLQQVGQADGPGAVLLPTQGNPAVFWKNLAQGGSADLGGDWAFLDHEQLLASDTSWQDSGQQGAGGALLVPSLASLDGLALPVAQDDTPNGWSRSDRDRQSFLDWRRKLCGLEVAALLAGPWQSVDIMDVRWWRMLRPLGDAGQGDNTWSGEGAAVGSCSGAYRTFNLPGWDEISLPQTIPSSPANDGSWPELLNQVRLDWELGRLDQWVLVVSKTAPAGGADAVAAGMAAGISSWPPAIEGMGPGPMLWVQPDDFSDPDLIAFINQFRPSAVLAGDVEGWLPRDNHDAQAGALALRSILDCGAAKLILQAHDLPAPWEEFLRSVSSDGVELSPSELDVPGAGELLPATVLAGDVCLACGEVEDPLAVTARFRTLLGRLRGILLESENGEDDEAQEVHADLEDQLVPVLYLARLAGLSSREIGTGVRILRWAARLIGEPLSDAKQDRASQPDNHSLLINGRFAELEKRLDSLEENLVLLLPLWLSSASGGDSTWIDLESPPAKVKAADMEMVDAFLIMATARSGQAHGLVYHCTRGMLNSNRRLVSCSTSTDVVMAGLMKDLRIFRSRVGDVMSSAVETGQGFLVQTGLIDLREDEVDFLVLGVVLHFWRWRGPASSEALYAVDLITLADSKTVRSNKEGWRLLAELFSASITEPEDNPLLMAATQGKPHHQDHQVAMGWRSWLTGQGKHDTLADAVDKVSAVVTNGSGPGFLVLKGMVGTGRHEALARGLGQAFALTPDPAEIVFYCPDICAATALVQAMAAFGMEGRLDIRIPNQGIAPQSQPQGELGLVDTSGSVVVMCEIQRFEPETRYRIAQMGRGKRLLMTVDHQDTHESWENMFLTTPRSSDIFTLEEQRRSVRKIWSEVRLMAGDVSESGSGSNRREKGSLITDYAANLDQCIGRIIAEHEAKNLPDFLRLVAPMDGDLEYLGSTLRDRGWLAVYESRLESLLLPGPREILACATDILARDGALTLAFGGADSVAEYTPGPSSDSTHDGTVHEPVPATPWEELLMPRLLDSSALPSWAQWLDREQDLGPETTLADLYSRISASNWGTTFLAHPQNRQHVLELLQEWGDEPLSGLLQAPLWEAWWYTMLHDLKLSGPSFHRPLATMTTVDHPVGRFVGGGVFLCLGTEPGRTHYAVMNRVTDHMLVLYQERSPMPGQGLS